MPAEDAQLQAVGGDTDRYDTELRPKLMRRAIAEIQDAGIEVDVWKIEGVDARPIARCSSPRPAPEDARASSAWSSAAAGETRRWTIGSPRPRPSRDFVGFAIGRSIWWDPLKAYVGGEDRTFGRRQTRSPRTICGSSRSTSTPRLRRRSPRRYGRDEDAAKPRRIGAGVRKRDLARPSPSSVGAAHDRAARAPNARCSAATSAGRSGSDCSC